MNPKSEGFTLLEIMIALAIFAICALVLLQQSGRSARQAQALEIQTFANWIAENELARLRLGASLPPPGDSETEWLFAKRQWLVTRSIASTSHPDLVRADIWVELAPPDESGRYRLTGFLGRH